MAILRIYKNHKVLHICDLEAEQNFIVGRGDGCDLVIKDTTVSASHFQISSMLGDYFISDTESKNGTFVNGQKITKHLLQDGDFIEFAGYESKFVEDLSALPKLTANSFLQISSKVPVMRVVSRTGEGSEFTIDRLVSTIGEQGKPTALIQQRPSGVYISKIDAANPVIVNQQKLNGAPYKLQDFDEIQIGAIKATVYFKDNDEGISLY